MSERTEFARKAEDQAADYLLSLGYTLVTRRFKVSRGEIDLICLDGETLVFVEVKARRAPGYQPEESIGERKYAAMGRAALEFIERMEQQRERRFDVIAIDNSGLRHHKDVFNR